MILKDASAYNIQFHCGKPVLIDTLSFEQYQEGRPWVAYRQFCQHFLAPLALTIFVLVFMALGTLRRASAVFLAVPLGLAGGVFTLALTGIAFSVSAAVGFSTV